MFAAAGGAAGCSWVLGVDGDPVVLEPQEPQDGGSDEDADGGTDQ